MFPVRVAVESVRSSHCVSCANDGHLLIDTYAIVAGSTLLNQLVETVLSALGHPHLAANARGMVQVNNWKALSFDQITDNPEETVNCLFKDISSHITLRILTKPSTSDSASAQCVNELKQKLLKAAINKNPQLLATLDQPLRELITQIVSGDDPSVLSHEQINVINEWLETLDTGDERRSPTAQVRFNQLFEIPKLEKWFKSEPNPSRQKLINYMNTLNSSQYRKSHAKISYQQICNWFQMQRASLRKANSNGTGNGNGLTQQQQLQAQLTQTFSLPTMLSEFRPKFDFSSFLEQKASLNLGDENRIDGGSDSPSPADDEIHSNSDAGGHND
ncbi:hypothetical protein WR25_11454 [Diploscapter pachys]|uniref:Uncharacterized protein n=1 Tax=Diploscapter pachys TaxID=2018661 RepID=A0A2A2J6L8_9BILA|nr:hypothetical protein WR25_11454 [Diploscapter pachys]